MVLSSWCTPVFVFCHQEASAASLSARLFLKDMRSYPAQPFPFPANPNKPGMQRESEREGKTRETEGTLFQRWAVDCSDVSRKSGFVCLNCPVKFKVAHGTFFFSSSSHRVCTENGPFLRGLPYDSSTGFDLMSRGAKTKFNLCQSPLMKVIPPADSLDD